MDMNEYMILAARTDASMDGQQAMLIAAMGMVGEGAECLEHMKKVIAQGHSLDRDKLIEEAGDCLWYVAKMARACGVSLDQLAMENVRKLRLRYPDGFDPVRSRNREDVWHD